MLHIYKGEKIKTEINKKPIANNLNEMPPVIIDKKSDMTIISNKDYNKSFEAFEDYINFGVPPMNNPSFLDKISYHIKGLFGGIYGKFYIHSSETFLSEYYQNRMVVKVPITILDNNIDKKILLASQIEHIKKHHQDFQFPYKFMSKNCAYIISDLLEVALPELRKKFNKKNYFSFAPKDVFKLLEGDINVNGHEAKQY